MILIIRPTRRVPGALFAVEEEEDEDVWMLKCILLLGCSKTSVKVPTAASNQIIFLEKVLVHSDQKPGLLMMVVHPSYEFWRHVSCSCLFLD